MRYKGFLYQAESWKKARRVVVPQGGMEFHAGELFPRVGFLVTNLEADSRAVVRFYNKRGTAEQWIKEGKQAVKFQVFVCPEEPRVPCGRAPGSLSMETMPETARTKPVGRMLDGSPEPKMEIPA